MKQSFAPGDENAPDCHFRKALLEHLLGRFEMRAGGYNIIKQGYFLWHRGC